MTVCFLIGMKDGLSQVLSAFLGEFFHKCQFLLLGVWRSQGEKPEGLKVSPYLGKKSNPRFPELFVDVWITRFLWKINSPTKKILELM